MKFLGIISAVLKKTASVLMTLIILVTMLIVVLYFCGIKPYIVITGSMEPAIHVGSICIVNERVSIKSIKTGDIISFRAGNKTRVTHRVVYADGESLRTKGDANTVEDSNPVTADNYIGKIVLTIPEAGDAVMYLKSGKGKVLAAAVIISLLLLGMIPEKSPESDRHDPGPERAEDRKNKEK